MTDLLIRDVPEDAQRIDAAQELGLVEADGDGVIAMARPGLPCGLLGRQDLSEPVRVARSVEVDGVVQKCQARLV